VTPTSRMGALKATFTKAKVGDAHPNVMTELSPGTDYRTNGLVSGQHEKGDSQ